MRPAEILAELQKLATRLGVSVRVEPFHPRDGGKGGLCVLRGSPLILLDEALPTLDKIGILSEALATFDLEPIFVPAHLRARIERHRGARRAPVRPPLRPPVKARLRRAIP